MKSVSVSKNFFRQLVFPAVTSLSLEKLFATFSKNNKLILVYHGVVSKPNHHISVGPIELKQFEEHLAYFSQNFSVISLTEIFDMYRSGYKPKKKTIALTFDDGYENNYAHVLPLLKKYNFPATIFIISQCLDLDIGSSITWYDYFDLVKDKIDFQKLDLDSLSLLNIKTTADLRKAIKGLSIDDRKLWFSRLPKLMPSDMRRQEYAEENWKLMNSEEVKMLSNSELIEIGAHSHNHPNLGEIRADDAKDEIIKSKQRIEGAIQKEVISFAFPDGSYTDRVKQIALEAGFKNLLALDYRGASDLQDKSILARYCLSSTTTYESNIIQVNRAFSSYGF